MDDKGNPKDISLSLSLSKNDSESGYDDGHSQANRGRKEDKPHKRHRRKRKSYDSSDDERGKKRKRRKKKTKRRHRSSKNSDSDSVGNDDHSSKTSSGSDSSYHRKRRKKSKRKSKRSKKELDSSLSQEVQTGAVSVDDSKMQTRQHQVASNNETFRETGIPPTTEIRDGPSPTTVSRRMVPMTREEYEAEQSQIREVYDPESGRTRLVRGRGEIIERIVSREMHQSINQQATRGDGASFSRTIYRATTSKRT